MNKTPYNLASVNLNGEKLTDEKSLLKLNLVNLYSNSYTTVSVFNKHKWGVKNQKGQTSKTLVLRNHPSKFLHCLSISICILHRGCIKL